MIAETIYTPRLQAQKRWLGLFRKNISEIKSILFSALRSLRGADFFENVPKRRQTAQKGAVDIVQNASKRYKVQKNQKNFQKSVDKWL